MWFHSLRPLSYRQLQEITSKSYSEYWRRKERLKTSRQNNPYSSPRDTVTMSLHQQEMELRMRMLSTPLEGEKSVTPNFVHNENHQELILPRDDSAKGDFKFMLKSMTPTFLAVSLSYVVETINLLFLGSVPDNKYLIAGVGFATTWVDTIGMATVYGFNGALDTLCSQAFGKGKYERLAIYLQRAYLINTIIFIPNIISYLTAEYYFDVFGVHDKAVGEAQSYLYGASLGALLAFYNDATRKFLYAQKQFNHVLLIYAICTPLHVFWCWLYMHVAGLNPGFAVGFAWTTTQLCQYVGMWSIVYTAEICTLTWTGWSLDSFKNMGAQVKLSLYSFACMSFEWWNWFIFTLTAARLGNDELGAMTVAVNISYFLAMPATGMGYSIAAIVGNALGAGEPKRARRFGVMSVIFSLCVAIVINTVIVLNGDYVATCFSEDEDLKPLIASLVPIICLQNIFDTIQDVEGGLIRGTGRQKISLFFSLTALYLISQPIGQITTWVLDWGIYGLWAGVLSASLGLAIAYFIVLFIITDYEKVSEEAQQRRASEVDESILDELEREGLLPEVNEIYHKMKNPHTTI